MYHIAKKNHILPKCIRATLGYTVGIVLFLSLLGLLHLARVQVGVLQLFVERFQGHSVHHVHWIDDVAQRLGHLTSVGIADHRVEVDFPEESVLNLVYFANDIYFGRFKLEAQLKELQILLEITLKERYLSVLQNTPFVVSPHKYFCER